MIMGLTFNLHVIRVKGFLVVKETENEKIEKDYPKEDKQPQRSQKGCSW